MVRGTLEVLLVSAKGLENTDFLSNMDPYVIITCRTQEHKSSVASGKGSDPEWNETFVFALSDDVPELSIKIMDSDNTSDDDFVGEAKIPLEGLFTEGSIPPTAYNVVKDEEYCGEIRVGLRFTPEASRQLQLPTFQFSTCKVIYFPQKSQYIERDLYLHLGFQDSLYNHTRNREHENLYRKLQNQRNRYTRKSTKYLNIPTWRANISLNYKEFQVSP